MTKLEETLRKAAWVQSKYTPYKNNGGWLYTILFFLNRSAMCTAEIHKHKVKWAKEKKALLATLDAVMETEAWSTTHGGHKHNEAIQALEDWEIPRAEIWTPTGGADVKC